MTFVHRHTCLLLSSLALFGALSLAGCGTGSSSTPTPLVQQGPAISYVASSVSAYHPSTSTAPIKPSYFGMHIQNLANPRLDSTRQTPFPNFSVSVLRLWDNVGWYSLEPSRDTYYWTRMDGTIAKAQANGVNDFLFTFGYVPQWASSNPTHTCGAGTSGSCDPPADIADLDNFANTIVQRYCGVVRYYETWNEPSLVQYWSGTNDQLLTVTQHIYKAVKSEANCGCTDAVCKPGGGSNPNKVLFPSISNAAADYSRTWLSQWLNFVGPSYPYADIGTFHGYGYASNPEDILSGTSYVRSALSQHGLATADLWNTEASWGDSSKGLTSEEQASWVIRYQMVQALSGVSRFMWYAYDNCSWGPLFDSAICSQTTTQTSTVNPAGLAYSTVQQWLTGASPQYCNEYADGTWLCKLTRTNDYVAWAAWNSKGLAVDVSASQLPGLVQYRDWQNQKTAIGSSVRIEAMPILLENKDPN